MSEGLAAERLTLGYGSTIIVPELSFALPRAKVTAIIGANGSGKSTLLHGLAGILRPLSGEVTLDGRNTRDMPPRELARRIGTLPQRSDAPPGMTVRDLVSQGRFPHRRLFAPWSDQDERSLLSALKRSGIADLAERRLDTLSGGQQQRAWIAMALAQETDILLLDEPTTFLDLAHQIDVMTLLRSLNEDQGVTVVAVLHDLVQAARHADHIVALKSGRIVRTGTPRDLLTPATIAEVFDVEAMVISDPVTDAPLCIPVARSGISQDRSKA
ncbi:MAG: ABC transporter ATP-binding protein [Pseudomonadota bacterium]